MKSKALQQPFLDRIEAASGKPVLLQCDSQFAGHATIKVATAEQPAHVFFYKPEKEPVLPYLVAFQCEFALRTILADPAAQFDLVAKNNMSDDVAALMRNYHTGKDQVPASAVLQLAGRFGNGLGLQLRSMPITMRIDKQIHDDHPELRAFQQQSIDSQLQENMHALSPRAKELAPEEIIRPNASMNARLGLCYSELGQYDQATLILEKLVELDPSHVHGIVGLGVAEVSRGNLLIGEEWLRNALAQESDNRWALRNLAASLMKQGRHEDALLVIAKCISVAPDDIAMMVAYGDCLDELGRGDESLAHYRAAIQTGGPEHVLDLAKSRLTKKSAEGLRGLGEIRTDVLEYMQQALEQFKSMSLSQIQGLALEIAMLGNQGMNIHKSDKMYQIKTLPGEYSALQLISMMYAAFQQFAPGTDVGIDLSKEYEIAAGKGGN